jgi:VCBS repeat-containing protein
MPTVPPTIDTPPTAPSRTSPSTFATLADAWVAWLEAEAPDIGTACTAAYTNASEAYASALNAQSAAAGVSAALWVSGTTYAIGDVRRSPANGYPYRRLTAGAGTTDPSADPTNWVIAAVFYPAFSVVSATSVSANAWWHYQLENASATTVTLPASPSVGDCIWVTVANGRVDNVLNRNTKNIMSLAENMTLNDPNATIQLRYTGATKGWRIV